MGPRPQNYEGRSSWKARPWLGRVVRLVLVLTPLLIAFACTWSLGKVFATTSWALGLRIGWAVAMFIVASIISTLISRSLSRMAPLAALCHMNLAFPDEAPNRLRLALKLGNSANTDRVVADFQHQGLALDPQQAAIQTLHLVEALNRHDRRTRGHSERVRALSEIIAVEMDLPEHDRNLLRWASLLHDIGKLSVPPEILNKKGKPTAEEWEILKGHPAAGRDKIAPLKAWLGDYALCIEQHHERFDGTGYPRGLRGGEMPLGSRIVAVADAFEVMTAARSYKKPMSFADARAELVACAGTHFDPKVVRAIIAVGSKKRKFAAGFLSSFTGELAASNSVASTLVAKVAGSSVMPSVMTNLGATFVRTATVAAAVSFASTASLPSAPVVPSSGEIAALATASTSQPPLFAAPTTLALPDEFALTAPATEPLNSGRVTSPSEPSSVATPIGVPTVAPVSLSVTPTTAAGLISPPNAPHPVTPGGTPSAPPDAPDPIVIPRTQPEPVTSAPARTTPVPTIPELTTRVATTFGSTTPVSTTLVPTTVTSTTSEPTTLSPTTAAPTTPLPTRPAPTTLASTTLASTTTATTTTATTTTATTSTTEPPIVTLPPVTLPATSTTRLSSTTIATTLPPPVTTGPPIPGPTTTVVPSTTVVPTVVPTTVVPTTVVPTTVVPTTVPSLGRISPIFECQYTYPDGSWAAQFGYNNTGTLTQSIPVGSSNRLVGTVLSGSPVATFGVGRVNAAFAVLVDVGGANLVWSLTSTDSFGLPQTSTSTGSPLATPCASDPLSPVVPTTTTIVPTTTTIVPPTTIVPTTTTVPTTTIVPTTTTIPGTTTTTVPPPIPACSAWTQVFFNNTGLVGPPLVAPPSCVNSIDMSNGVTSPGNGVNNDNFSAEFVRKVPNTGPITFNIRADDGFRIFVDGVNVADEWVSSKPDHDHTYTYTPANPTAPTSTIEIEYLEYTGISHLQLSITVGGAALPFQTTNPAVAASRVLSATPWMIESFAATGDGTKSSSMNSGLVGINDIVSLSDGSLAMADENLGILHMTAAGNVLPPILNQTGITHLALGVGSDTSGLYFSIGATCDVKRVELTQLLAAPTHIAGIGSCGSSPDGNNPALGMSFQEIVGIAFEPGGRMLVADSDRIWQSNPPINHFKNLVSSKVATLGSGSRSTEFDLGQVTSFAVGSTTIAIADLPNRGGSPNGRISILDINTDIVTVAIDGAPPFEQGGDPAPANGVLLGRISGMAVAPTGDVIYSDEDVSIVSIFTSSLGGSGFVSHIAGQSNVTTRSGDGGTAYSAALDHPTQLLLSGSGLYVCEDGRPVVRRLW